MPYLGNNLGVAFSSYKLIDSLTASFNGTTTSFALTVNGVTPVPFPLNEQNILLSVGGVPQKPDSTGTEGFRFSGSNIVFSSAPKTGEAFWGVVLAGADRVNAGVQYPDGTASAPSISFASQTTTGFYRSGSGQIGVGINGSTPVAFSTSGVQLNGSTSGSVIIASPAVAGNNTLTLPTSNGSANQFLKNGSTAGSLNWSSLQENSAGALGVGGANFGTVGQVITSNGTGAAPSWQTTTPGTSISVGNTSATVTDTGSNGAFTVVTEGSTRLSVIQDGTILGGGLTTSRAVYSVQGGGLYSATQWPQFANNEANYLGPVFWKSLNNTIACEMSFVKTRGSTIGSAGTVQANDSIGLINFIATDSANPYPCVSIQAYAEATVSSSNSPGRLVFGTTTSGTAAISEKLRITNNGTIAYNQPTPTSKSAAATLTVAELQTGIIEYTGAAATLTLPTGTLTEGGFAGIYTNMAFEWSVINTGSGICTIGAGTAHTIVGSDSIAIGASARFASRRTAANTFVSYRLS